MTYYLKNVAEVPPLVAGIFQEGAEVTCDNDELVVNGYPMRKLATCEEFTFVGSLPPPNSPDNLYYISAQIQGTKIVGGFYNVNPCKSGKPGGGTAVGSWEADEEGPDD